MLSMLRVATLVLLAGVFGAACNSTTSGMIGDSTDASAADHDAAVGPANADPNDAGEPDDAQPPATAQDMAGAVPVSTASLDCTQSSQSAVCDYVKQAYVAKSAAATQSTACENPENPVSVNPTNFVSVLGGVAAGQSVVFAPGTYNVTASVNIVSGVHYCGKGGASQVILNGNNVCHMFNGDNVSDVVIDGFTMNGAGVSADLYTNVYIQNNVIQNFTSDYPCGVGVFIPGGAGSGAVNTTVTGNTFKSILGPSASATGGSGKFSGAGIQAYSLQNVVIADNSFVSVPEGMHMLFQDSSSNIRIARNQFVEGHRVDIELQASDGTPIDGLVVEDNAVVFPLMGGYIDTYGFAISAAIPGAGMSPKIRNNWLFGSQGNYTSLGVVGIELAGQADSVTNNVMEYWNNAMIFSDNGPSMTVTNNSICDVQAIFGEDGGFNGYAGTATNNACTRSATGYAAP